VRQRHAFRPGCDDLPDSGVLAARRRAQRDAIFGPRADPASTATTVVTGQVIDVSPHVIVVQSESGETRLPMSPDTTAWRGGAVRPAALHEGDRAVIRTKGPAAARIWAQIGRVTGTIIETDGRELLVDTGPGSSRQIVVIDEGPLWRIQVRFPRLEPGFLLDVIGLRQEGYLRAQLPATYQPPYRADHPPTPPLVSGHVPDPVSGAVVWHEPGEEPDDLLGVAYPALDPETDCGQNEHQAERHAVDPHAFGTGCVRLPYLSVSSLLRLRNECADRTRILPVTSCGAFARLFCDRCVECGTSPKGRIADLTMAAFVELGGNLEVGCFNASMTVVT
jgi:hypothetical protein